MRPFNVSVGIVGVALLAACNPMTTAQTPGPTTNVVERALDMQAVLAFNDCVNEGKTRDISASTAMDPALYLSSADMLVTCDDQLGTSTQLADKRDRMQISALAVQNYLKGGDVAKARLALNKFEEKFGPGDLIFSDGSSFTSTMHALVFFQNDQREQLALSSLNAKSRVKDEIRRAWYWQKN